MFSNKWSTQRLENKMCDEKRDGNTLKFIFDCHHSILGDKSMKFLLSSRTHGTPVKSAPEYLDSNYRIPIKNLMDRPNQ